MKLLSLAVLQKLFTIMINKLHYNIELLYLKAFACKRVLILFLAI